MKLTTNLRLSDNLPRLVVALNDLVLRISEQVNRLTEGQVAAVHNAATAAPTTGRYAQGDFIRNSTPTEQGAAGSKYVVAGWLCVSGGEPGTWVACRYLTGN